MGRSKRSDGDQIEIVVWAGIASYNIVHWIHDRFLDVKDADIVQHNGPGEGEDQIPRLPSSLPTFAFFVTLKKN